MFFSFLNFDVIIVGKFKLIDCNEFFSLDVFESDNIENVVKRSFFFVNMNNLNYFYLKKFDFLIEYLRLDYALFFFLINIYCYFFVKKK